MTALFGVSMQYICKRSYRNNRLSPRLSILDLGVKPRSLGEIDIESIPSFLATL